jgi:phosphatidylserine decarboxylase
MEAEGVLMSLLMIPAGVLGSLLFWSLLSVKWRFRFRPALQNAMIAALCVGILMPAIHGIFPSLNVLGLWILEAFAILLFSTGLIAAAFYRDPERIPPPGKNIIVSPADGTVRYIVRIRGGNIPHSTKKDVHIPLTEFIHFEGFHGSDLVQIGIEMNVLNVHINRAPVGGKVIFKKHVRGRFLSLRDGESLARNERMVHVIDQGRFRVAVVQIASRLVRRIVSYCTDGEALALGQRIGMIKFGSQVDLLIQDQPKLRIRIREGDTTLAGETVVASLDGKGI